MASSSTDGLSNITNSQKKNSIGEIFKLFEDDAMGSALDCSCVFPSLKALLVARSQGIFAYDADEGNLSAIPLDGKKIQLMSYRQASFLRT